MRVLVTGAGGFAGPWVVRALAARGHEAHALVRNEPPERLVACGVSVHRADLLDGVALAQVLEAVRPGAVVHLAGVTFVPDATRDPLRAYRGNLEATVTLLGALRDRVPGSRLLHVGTSEVYGAARPDELPLTEAAPWRPLTVYAVSKAAAELAVLQAVRADGTDALVARPFNHTGPGQAPTFVCSALARQVAAAEFGLQPALLQVGNMDPVRDFSDVRDIASGYVDLLERGRRGEAYNLCSGVGTSVADVIAILRTLARLPLAVRRDPGLVRPVEVERIVGSAEKAQREAGFRVRSDVTQALADLLANWRAVLASKA